jgi:hypothetical protein
VFVFLFQPDLAQSEDEDINAEIFKLEGQLHKQVPTFTKCIHMLVLDKHVLLFLFLRLNLFTILNFVNPFLQCNKSSLFDRLWIRKTCY